MTELLAGRYQLVETVGKGATGQVWKGFDTLLHRDVAIKLVQIEDARDPAMGERFRREGIAIAGLNHDSVVQVYDTGTDPERGWLVMELLSGPNINQLVKSEGPVSHEAGMKLLARVADGLQAAHDAGIAHRDVKPANIVLDAPATPDGTRPDLYAHPELGRPVLVDFGIARIVDEAGAGLTRPATAIGTAAYMSPEQARGMDVDTASDVYSLACVTYYLLLGRPPFQAPSSLAVAHSQAYDTPVPMIELSPGIPPALDGLVRRMLAKAPQDRPTASEAAAELRAISADPGMAPTAALTPAAPTELLTRTRVLTDEPAGTGQPTPIGEPTGTIEPAPVEQGGPMRHAGRVVVGVLIAGLVAALVWLWSTREAGDPLPTPTVTLTHTQTATAQPTQDPTSDSTRTTAPEPTQPPVTQPPPATDTQTDPDPDPGTEEPVEPTDTEPTDPVTEPTDPGLEPPTVMPS
ncbi:MAG: serine/threonine-protein kinase [Brooklawnia sp.]|jgi:serine/threonine protein kinase